jgi:hypothetical protein
MPTAVPELIAIELKSRLEAITVANGYEITAQAVYRVNRDATGWTPRDKTLVISQQGAERDEEADHEGNPPAIGFVLPFLITGFVRQSDRATAPDQSRVNQMEASIRKAITSEANWHTFDGNAYNAQLGGASNISEDEGRFAGVAVELQVFYRVSETDPYTVRA